MQSESAERSRRDVLQTAAALGATGMVTSVAGCQQIKDALGMGTNHAKKVPEDADSLTYMDIAAVLEDEAVKKLANTFYDEMSQRDYYEGPSDWEEAKEDFEDETELDLSKAEWTLGFSKFTDSSVDSEYSGSIIKGSWGEDAVVDAMEEGNPNVDYEEDEYEGKTVYEPSEDYASAMGVLSDTEYVSAPTMDVVEDVIDVYKGNADPMEKELRKGYSNTRSAPIRYVTRMAPNMEGEVGQGDNQVDLETLQDVKYMAGSIYKDGKKRGTENAFVTEDEDTAGDVADVLKGLFAIVENDESASDLLKGIAEDVEVEEKGKKAVLSYAAKISKLEDMLEESLQTPTPY